MLVKKRRAEAAAPESAVIEVHDDGTQESPHLAPAALDAAAKAVIAHDYSKLRRRCLRKLPACTEDNVDEIITEYKRFLVLKLRCERRESRKRESPSVRLTPSTRLERVWQLHVLDTDDYAVELDNACGCLIAYDPDKYDTNNRWSECERTKLAYAALWSAEPPGIWTESRVPSLNVLEASVIASQRGFLQPRSSRRVVLVQPLNVPCAVWCGPPILNK